MSLHKNPHAVALGRMGGQARTSKLTPEERRRIAQHAIRTRWARVTREHPLSRLRLDRGLSQQELAERAGVSVREIKRLEAGEASPSWRTIVRLAKAFEVKEQTLLGGGSR